MVAINFYWIHFIKSVSFITVLRCWHYFTIVISHFYFWLDSKDIFVISVWHKILPLVHVATRIVNMKELAPRVLPLILLVAYCNGLKSPPTCSTEGVECKFDDKHVIVEHAPSQKFKVSIKSSIFISFHLTLESVYRGPGKPFLIELKFKGT